MGRWWHTVNIHLVLTSGKKLFLVECVGSLEIFYGLFLIFFFFSFSSSCMGVQEGQWTALLCCNCWFTFQTIFLLQPVTVLLWFWLCFVFQSLGKSERIKSRLYDGCGFYEYIAQLHVSDTAHCLLAAPGTSQSVFSLPLLLPSILHHSDGHRHLQSCCCCSPGILLGGFRMWRCEKVKWDLNWDSREIASVFPGSSSEEINIGIEKSRFSLLSV